MTIGAGLPLFGYDSFLGVGQESTWGSFTGVGVTFVEFNSESIKKTHEELLLEAINGQRAYKRRMSGNISVGGSIDLDCNVASDAICNMLWQAMGGSITCSTVTANVYTHTMNWGNMNSNKRNSGSASAADLKGLGFQIRKGGDGTHTGTTTWNVYGARINTLTIKGEIGKPVTMAVDVVAKGMSVTSSTPTTAFSDINPLLFDSVNFYLGSLIASTTVDEETIQSFELTINNNLVSDNNARELGSRQLSIGPPPTRMDVKLKVTQRYDTVTAYNRWLANTMCAITIKCVSSTYITASTTAGTCYSLHIKLPGCYLNNPMVEVGGPDLISQNLEFSCILDTMGSYPVQLTVNNGTENY